jgi:hypothetical protein
MAPDSSSSDKVIQVSEIVKTPLQVSQPLFQVFKKHGYDSSSYYFINEERKKTIYYTSFFPSGFLKRLFDRCGRPSPKSIPVARGIQHGRRIRPLAVQSWVDAAISIVMVSIPLNRLIDPAKYIFIGFTLLDRVAPVGRDKPVVRVIHAERGSQTTDHATGTIWTALHLIDALNEHVVGWRVRRELQYDLVCPIVYRLNELVIRLGTLLVLANFHVAVKLPPELEVDLCDTNAPNKVPCDKRIVELLSRVEGREELWLGDDVCFVSRA